MKITVYFCLTRTGMRIGTHLIFSIQLFSEVLDDYLHHAVLASILDLFKKEKERMRERKTERDREIEKEN